jgi:predicted metalloenzyme YecM
MRFTKGYLIKLAPNPDQIDVAMDINFAKQLKEYGINPDHYATDYSDNKVNGKLISLIELENEELKRIISENNIILLNL